MRSSSRARRRRVPSLSRARQVPAKPPPSRPPSLIRRILEGDTPIEGNIITYEAPIEFVFEAVSSPTCTISQHEIGVHLPDFASGVRNALRRKPGLIVVGELRDMDTIMAAVEAANTGHPLYTTLRQQRRFGAPTPLAQVSGRPAIPGLP